MMVLHSVGPGEVAFFKKHKKKFAIFVLVLLLPMLFLYLISQLVGSFRDTTEFELLTDSRRTTPQPALIVLNPSNWDELACTPCLSAVYSRGTQEDADNVPLLFTTAGRPKPAALNTFRDVEEIAMSGFGKDRGEISRNIASQYYSRMTTAVVVASYTYACRAAPLASALNAPLLYLDGLDEKWLRQKGIRSVILAGCEHSIPPDTDFKDVGERFLRTPEDVWKLQAEVLLKSKLPSVQESLSDGYMVVVNPVDIDYSNSSIWIKGLSMAGVLLACQKNAFVIAGDFTWNQSKAFAVGFGTGEAGSGERGEDPDTCPDEVEKEYQLENAEKVAEIDGRVHELARFLDDNGIVPRYLALCGDTSSVPMLYFKSPIWFEEVQQDEKGEEYVASDAYYADLELVLTADNASQDNNFNQTSPELYTPELAVGRLVAPDELDASLLVERTVHYWKRVFKGISHEVYRYAEIVNSLVCGDADTMAGRQQTVVFLQNQMITKYYAPRKTFLTHIIGVRDFATSAMTTVNAIIYDGHGYPDGWYHMWSSTHNNEDDWDRIYTNLHLNLCPYSEHVVFHHL
ncbi:MAG: C25 family cysteine peptidase [Thermoplasmata archaeon]